MKKIGSVYDINLHPEGSFVKVILFKDKNVKEFILGQYTLMKEDDNSEKAFLLRVESINPDFDNSLGYKEALRNSILSNRKVDDNYLNDTNFLSYKLKILGSVDLDSAKFYSNVRTLPAISSLGVYIPTEEFMTKLLKSAVMESDNSLSMFEIGSLCYGNVDKYTTDFYKKPIPVYFNASNILRKRTGFFGKSGYGKSNNVKIVVGMVATQFGCSQLIFDTNGEYGLDNDQNDGFLDIFHEAGLKGKTVLYTARRIHPEKKKKFGDDVFKPLRFDVFENIPAALDIVVSNLNGQTPPMYLQSWVNECHGVENVKELFSNAPNKGIIWGLWFKACLDAGLIPTHERTSVASVQLSKEFLNEVVFKLNKEDENLPSTFDGLSPVERKNFLDENDISEDRNRFFSYNIETMALYATWKAHQVKKNEKDEEDPLSTDGSSLKAYIDLIKNYRRLFQLKGYNLGQLPDAEKRGAKTISLAENVWKDMLENKIIIVDLASVPSMVAQTLTEQIASFVLSRSSQLFGDYQQRDVFKDFEAVIYVEEAQNYLSKEKVSQGGIFERIAKEGRKFHLGLVYITQQPSAIDEKITSQTENIIAMHMSNSSDTTMLNRIKDKFDTLTCQFLKEEPKKGLAYLYSEPHQPFTLPAQIHMFNKDLIIKSLKHKKKNGN